MRSRRRRSASSSSQSALGLAGKPMMKSVDNDRSGAARSLRMIDLYSSGVVAIHRRR